MKKKIFRMVTKNLCKPLFFSISCFKIYHQYYSRFIIHTVTYDLHRKHIKKNKTRCKMPTGVSIFGESKKTHKVFISSHWSLPFDQHNKYNKIKTFGLIYHYAFKKKPINRKILLAC